MTSSESGGVHALWGETSSSSWIIMLECILDKQGVLESITFELLGSHEGLKWQRDGWTRTQRIDMR